MRTLSIVVLSLALVACEDDNTSLDSGSASDAGDGDGGARVDAGDPPLDAGGGDDAGASDAGPSDGGGAAACAFFDGLDRGCNADGNCGRVVHQTDCCGTEVVRGVNHSEVARFGTLEPACRASYPGCDCAPSATLTDSMEVVTDLATVQVGCIARGPTSSCMTYVSMRPAGAP